MHCSDSPGSLPWDGVAERQGTCCRSNWSPTKRLRSRISANTWRWRGSTCVWAHFLPKTCGCVWAVCVYTAADMVCFCVEDACLCLHCGDLSMQAQFNNMWYDNHSCECEWWSVMNCEQKRCLHSDSLNSWLRCAGSYHLLSGWWF